LLANSIRKSLLPLKVSQGVVGNWQTRPALRAVAHTALRFRLWGGPHEARKGRGLDKREETADRCAADAPFDGGDGVWLGKRPLHFAIPNVLHLFHHSQLLYW
jgi:hypothetical protein